ncbi:MAG: hypothetical protein U1E73_05150 [Planctomycetota bacterium]
MVRHLKNCRASILQRVGLRFAEQVDLGRFQGILGTDVLLVPAPRSSPAVRDMNWPALRICRELEGRQLCGGIACMLERHAAVPKSALVTKGTERPTPEQHAASMRCTSAQATPPTVITIVDDVVTRGSTLLGCAWVLAGRFPEATIRALAVVRTMSGIETIESILDPVDQGRIHLRSRLPRRDP